MFISLSNQALLFEISFYNNYLYSTVLEKHGSDLICWYVLDVALVGCCIGWLLPFTCRLVVAVAVDFPFETVMRVVVRSVVGGWIFVFL